MKTRRDLTPRDAMVMSLFFRPIVNTCGPILGKPLVTMWTRICEVLGYVPAAPTILFDPDAVKDQRPSRVGFRWEREIDGITFGLAIWMDDMAVLELTLSRWGVTTYHFTDVGREEMREQGRLDEGHLWTGERRDSVGTFSTALVQAVAFLENPAAHADLRAETIKPAPRPLAEVSAPTGQKSPGQVAYEAHAAHLLDFAREHEESGLPTVAPAWNTLKPYYTASWEAAALVAADTVNAQRGAR